MNQIKRVQKIAVYTALIMVASAVLSPVAVAQQPSLTFATPSVSYSQGSSAALTPDTGLATVKFDWKFKIQDPARQQVGTAQSGTLLNFDQLQCEDSNLKVSGATSLPIALTNNQGAPQSEDEGEAIFLITATQLAPGEQPIGCTFRGKTDPAASGQLQESNPATARTTVVVAYLGLISASIPTTIQQAGPQKQIKYDIEVRNLGNSFSNIRFTLRDAEAAAAGGWNPVVPVPVVLNSEALGSSDTTQTVSFLISTPFKNGWNNAEKTFTLDITPESTKNPEFQGGTVTVNVLARVRGVYVPSLEPMVMVGAVIGAAMLARKLRDEE